MSGEYYSTGDDDIKLYPENDPRPSGQKTFHSEGSNLLEMETQIEMAEYRCNTLRDQLDLMKETYGLKKQSKSRKISNISAEKKAIDDGLDASSASSLELGRDKNKSFFLKKQVSQAIGTDKSGAAVRTINNILNGITNSVNRLSELQVQISDSPKKRFSSKVSPHLVVNLVDFEGNQPMSVKDLRVDNPAIKVSTKSKNIKRKPKELKSQPTRRTAKNERRIKTASSTKGSSLIPNNSMVSRSKLHTPAIPAKKTSGKIVELYHNFSVKNSDSDETTLMKSEKAASDEKMQMTPVREDSIVKTLVPEEAREYRVKPQEIRQRVFRNVQVSYDQPGLASNAVAYYSKSYELPTIASRMKQAAKCYLGPFSIKTIPFCAAISTSPSHNIGINIQQVMSILKTKQPVNGISPTLVHNIEMAANQFHSRPLSTLLTSINSRMSYKPSQCPLSKSLLNYQQLQEMAKTIPEETSEDLDDKVHDESPKVNTIVVTGPSGDVEVKASTGPIWAAESSHDSHCTCIRTSGMNLQQIVNKYKRPSSSNYTNTVLIQRNRILPRTGKKGSRNELKRKTPAIGSMTPTPLENVASDNPLGGKEKNLKEVLMNLHDEFEFLNKRYENLGQGGTGDDADTIRELEAVENALNKKEEEINMVMTLYKEVLALKQQIKTLKDKTSQASVQKRESREENSFKNYTHPKAALHLTKLLRQIQTYQMKYKKSGAEI